ncbi:Uncharacterised protein [Amycolatopsis camponoti]|uniref:Uncharacterized protein n=1 Tax=Amycolatopsis camponoti TaxID=2606593 RepID=A0A6I8LCQ0_9PSEU|nr:hypothetical protein [Amycolatopsis camponoti]VVJ14988.1 Uncharacterised protein [Amycolatopsis camponoti]
MRDWGGMIAEIITAAVPTLVTRLADEFFAKRRDSVDVGELQEQVARLVAEKTSLGCELAEIRQAVLVLARYLAVTRQDVFVLETDHLALTERFRIDREKTVVPVIDDFRTRVERSVERRQNNAIESFRRRAEGLPGRGEIAPAVIEGRAVDDFLSDFSEEVLRLRTGRDEGRS